jgi:hypothetical protein
VSDLGFIDWLMTERSLVGLVGLDQVLEGITVLGKLFGRDLCGARAARRGEWELSTAESARSNECRATHARTFS